MAKLVAVIACPSGIAQTFMAAEALRRAASEVGHHISIETQGSVGTHGTLSAEQIAEADAVILAVDGKIDEGRFKGKPLTRCTTKEAIRNAAGIVSGLSGTSATPQSSGAQGVKVAPTNAAAAPKPLEVQPKPAPTGLSLVGITSCPTGIAHTFMAAEGLESGAWARATR